MIRVGLPAHLRTLARAAGDVEIQVEHPVTLGAVLDAIEDSYPILRGTFRDHVILEYETPKYDPEPDGAPNCLVPLDDELADAKVRHLLEAYPSQASKPWFTRDVFLGVLRLRGIQARVRFAEAFYARKIVLIAP